MKPINVKGLETWALRKIEKKYVGNMMLEDRKNEIDRQGIKCSKKSG